MCREDTSELSKTEQVVCTPGSVRTTNCVPGHRASCVPQPCSTALCSLPPSLSPHSTREPKMERRGPGRRSTSRQIRLFGSQSGKEGRERRERRGGQERGIYHGNSLAYSLAHSPLSPLFANHIKDADTVCPTDPTSSRKKNFLSNSRSLLGRVRKTRFSSSSLTRTKANRVGKREAEEASSARAKAERGEREKKS